MNVRYMYERMYSYKKANKSKVSVTHYLTMFGGVLKLVK